MPSELDAPSLERDGPSSGLLGGMTFQQQIIFVFAVCIILMAAAAAAGSAWQGSKQVRDDVVKQSISITSVLASEAKLAFLTGAPENVADAVNGTLGFPDVLRVELRKPDGQYLLHKGKGDANINIAELRLHKEPYLASENSDSWTFVAPTVASKADSPFDFEDRSDQVLGYAVVVISKASLQTIVTNICMFNLMTSVFVIAASLIAIHMLCMRIAHPLDRLSRLMSRAESGDVHVRSPLDGPKDIQTMAMAFNRMIAALQERGDELANHRDRLEELVKHRTEELASSKDMAESSVQAKSEFMSNMSAALRAKLKSVNEVAERIRSSPTLSEGDRVGIDCIGSGIDGVLAMVDDIVDLSEMETGGTRLDLHPVDLASVMTHLVEPFDSACKHKGVALSMDVAERVPRSVLLDEHRLCQMLRPLIDNAVRFTAAGSVKVSVDVVSADQSRDRVVLRFAVKDTGVGISPEHMPRIFDAFAMDVDGQPDASGSGLGLALAKGLAGLMGGSIKVASELGEGSRFWVDLALPVSALDPQVGQPYSFPDSLRGRRVLVVDDSAPNRNLLASRLRGVGLLVDEATHGIEAISRIAANVPDLVILDLAMPVMDGLEVLRRIRSGETVAASTLRVFTMSAASGQPQSDQAIAAGATRHFTKPFPMEDLFTRLADTLSNAGSVV